MKILVVHLTLFALIFSNIDAFAQLVTRDGLKKTDSVRAPKSYWATFGLGGGTVGINFASTANAQLWGSGLVTASLHGENNFGSGPSQLGYSVHINDFDLLFGKVFKQKVSFITISAGLGATHVVSHIELYGRQSINHKNLYALNMPILIQGYQVLAEPVAFGFNIYVNLNNIRPTAGITINLALGRMTTRNGKTVTSEHPQPPPHPPHFSKSFPFLLH